MQRLGKLRGGEPASRARSKISCKRLCYCGCKIAQKKNSTKGRHSNKLGSKRGVTIAKQVATNPASDMF